MSVVNEIKYDYGSGKAAASVIKKVDYQNMKIFCTINEYQDGSNTIDTNDVSIAAIGALPYFNKNIYYNLNDGANDMAYTNHAMDINNQNVIDQIGAKGVPDMIIGICSLYPFFKNEVTLNDYAVIGEYEAGFIWKGEYYPCTHHIWLKKDLLAQYPDLKIYN